MWRGSSRAGISSVVSDVVRAHGVAGGSYGEKPLMRQNPQQKATRWARPNGSSAPATAWHYGFQLPLLLKLFCNQSCGHQLVDMLSLLLGRSRPGRQLVKVFSASLVRMQSSATTRRDSSRRPGKTHCKHGRIIGHAAMVRRSRTGHVVDMFAGRTQRHVARALALGRLSPGGLRAVLGGGSK